jgi:1-hydroxycarotenoid 3,4-desaturase
VTKRRVVIIGAGIGGLTAAALLAAQGEDVLVLERAAAAGGKLREIAVAGRPIDAGPTVFTMRWVFDEIFAAAGAAFDDHVKLAPLSILARHAWTAGSHLDLHADVGQSAAAIGAFAGAAEARRFLSFSAEARYMYGLLRQPFLLAQRPNPAQLAAGRGLFGLKDMLRINPFETLWHALGRHFHDPRLRQLFGRYATYCGSSPFLAPATLMLVSHVEQEGVWSVAGGMSQLAAALQALAERHGAQFRFATEASVIETAGGRVSGVRTAAGEAIACQEVVLNGDVNALASGLFGTAAARVAAAVPPPARSLSAVTWTAVARATGFPLVRHNVFFSPDYQAEFRQLADGFPAEPTVYVCGADRDAPVEGAERLLVLVNAPAFGDRPAVPLAAIEAAMRRRLAACGLEIEWQTATTVVTAPADFARLFPATGGALYGRASHGWMASFQRPGAQTALPGLFLAGGSVHPGPGVPMAALSGRLAAESLLGARGLMPPWRRMATAGGTSTR